MISADPMRGDSLPGPARLLLRELGEDWRRLAFDSRPLEAGVLESRGLAVFRRRRSRLGVMRWQGRLTEIGRMHKAGIEREPLP